MLEEGSRVSGQRNICHGSDRNAMRGTGDGGTKLNAVEDVWLKLEWDKMEEERIKEGVDQQCLGSYWTNSWCSCRRRVGRKKSGNDKPWKEKMRHSQKLTSTSFQRGTLNPAVMLIFSSPCCRPACCFSSICFNKSGITRSPLFSPGPGWCSVECLLLSATPFTHSEAQPSISGKGCHFSAPW